MVEELQKLGKAVGQKSPETAAAKSCEFTPEDRKAFEGGAQDFTQRIWTRMPRAFFLNLPQQLLLLPLFRRRIILNLKKILIFLFSS